MDPDFLERIIILYEHIFKDKEEWFLLGYLTALGGELGLWNEIQHDLALLKANAEFWLPIVEESLKIRKEVFDKTVKETKALLRKKLEDRGAGIPEWLQRRDDEQCS